MTTLARTGLDAFHKRWSGFLMLLVLVSAVFTIVRVVRSSPGSNPPLRVVAITDQWTKPAAAGLPVDAPAGSKLAIVLRTLESDPEPRKRLFAIDLLRLLGTRDDRRARIKTALHAAMNDPDPSVASSARGALAELLD